MITESHEKMLATLVYLDHAAANLRLTLTEKLNKGEKDDAQWADLHSYEGWLWFLREHVVMQEVEAVSVFSVDFFDDDEGTPVNLELQLDGETIAAFDCTGTLQSVLTNAETQIQAHWVANAINGGSEIRDNKIYIYGPASFNEKGITVIPTGGSGDSYARLDQYTQFSGGREIGALLSFTGNGWMQKLYDWLIEQLSTGENISTGAIGPPKSCKVPATSLRSLSTVSLSVQASDFVISADGSKLFNGVAITPGSNDGSVKLVYEFFDVSVLSSGLTPLAKAKINPGGDASDSNDWEYVSGSLDETNFNNQIVGQMSGTGWNITYDRNLAVHMGSRMLVRLTIEETASVLDSMPSFDFRSLNDAPTAGFTFSVGGSPTEIVFDSSASVSGECSPSGITAYLWRFGDGQTSVSPNPTHNYASIGVYEVTLEVTNACGQTDAVQQTVSISDTADLYLMNGNPPGTLDCSALDALFPSPGILFNDTLYTDKNVFIGALNGEYGPDGAYDPANCNMLFSMGIVPVRVELYKAVFVDFVWDDGPYQSQVATCQQIAAQVATEEGLYFAGQTYYSLSSFVAAVNALAFDYEYDEATCKVRYTGVGTPPAQFTIGSNEGTLVYAENTRNPGISYDCASIDALFPGTGVIFNNLYYTTKTTFLAAVLDFYSPDAQYTEENCAWYFSAQSTPPAHVPITVPTIVPFRWADGPNAGLDATCSQITDQLALPEGMIWDGNVYNDYNAFKSAINATSGYKFDDGSCQVLYTGSGPDPAYISISTNPSTTSYCNPFSGAGGLPAIPGVRGWADTRGAFEGLATNVEPTIYYVTSLADTATAGTLRYGLENLSGNRIIIPLTSGVIVASDTLGYINVSNGNITIAGSFAPGQGLLYHGNIFFYQCDNVVIENFRIFSNNRNYPDCLSLQECNNVILANMSFAYGYDEIVEAYDGCSKITFWRCLFNSPVDNSSEQAKWAITDDVDDLMFAECLFANAHSRMPLHWGRNIAIHNCWGYNVEDRWFQMGNFNVPSEASIQYNLTWNGPLGPASSGDPWLGRESDGDWPGVGTAPKIYVKGNAHDSNTITVDQTTLVGEFTGGTIETASPTVSIPNCESDAGTELLITDIAALRTRILNMSGCFPKSDHLTVESGAKSDANSDGSSGSLVSVPDTSPVVGAIPTIPVVTTIVNPPTGYDSGAGRWNIESWWLNQYRSKVE